MLWLATAREDLNDDHAATAARARCWQQTRLIRFGGSIRLRLRHARRHGEQLAGPRNVGAAIAIGVPFPFDPDLLDFLALDLQVLALSNLIAPANFILVDALMWDLSILWPIL